MIFNFRKLLFHVIVLVFSMAVGGVFEATAYGEGAVRMETRGRENMPGNAAGQAEKPPAPERARTVAVITFETLPKEMKDNQWIGAGFAESISTRLDAANFESLNVYDRRELNKTLKQAGVSQVGISESETTSLKKTVEVVQSARIDLLVIGSFQVVGLWSAPETKFEFNGYIVDEEKGSVDKGSAISVSGEIGSGGTGLFAAQAALAEKIATALGIDPASYKGLSLDRGEVSDITAFKLYTEAMLAFDSGDHAAAKSGFFAAYNATGGAYHSALVMYEKADELRIDELEKTASGNPDTAAKINAEIADGDKLLEDLEAKQQQHLATIKFVRAARAHWKQKRFYDSGDKQKADGEGNKAINFLDQFDDLNASISWKMENVKDFQFSTDTLYVNVFEGDIDNPTNSRLVAVEQKTGNELWRYETKGVITWKNGVIHAGGAVFVQTYIGKSNNPDHCVLVALDEKTGKELWRFEPEGSIDDDGVELSGSAVFVQTYGHHSSSSSLVALDEKTGKELWRFETTIGIVEDGVKLSGGVVFVRADGLVALDEKTGKELWRMEPERGITGFQLSGGAVFVWTYGKHYSSDGSGLVALDEKTGKELWKCDSPKTRILNFARGGDRLFIQTSQSSGWIVLVMDLNKAKKMLSEGKKWWKD